eukprot:COSAG02_NODE_1320_length_13269_cov_11.420058_4_plen_232_part_00
MPVITPRPFAVRSAALHPAAATVYARVLSVPTALAAQKYNTMMLCKHPMSSATTSALDNISSVNMLEMLITQDPRWSWIVGAWEQSEDESHRDLAKRVKAFRADFLEKTAKLTLQVQRRAIELTHLRDRKDGTVVGFITVKQKSQKAFFTALAASNDFRRQGHGTQLSPTQVEATLYQTQCTHNSPTLRPWFNYATYPVCPHYAPVCPPIYHTVCPNIKRRETLKSVTHRA